MAQIPEIEDFYTGDGSTRDFQVTFTYLSQADVFVQVNGASVGFVWNSTGIVRLDAAPAVGAAIRIYRSTPAQTTAHSFEGGVPFLPRFVDENNKQLLFVVQEAVDTSNEANDRSIANTLLSEQAVETANTAEALAAQAVLTSQAAENTANSAASVANDAHDIATDAMDLVLAAGVQTFNGRNGIVVPQLGDYSAALVGYGAGTVQSALDDALAVTAVAVVRDTPTGAAQLPSGTTAQRPTPSAGRLRFNSTLGRYEGGNGSTWGSLGGATGGGADDVFYENSKTIASSYTLSTGKNAMSAGPISIADGATITIPDGSTWSIV